MADNKEQWQATNIYQYFHDVEEDIRANLDKVPFSPSEITSLPAFKYFFMSMPHDDTTEEEAKVKILAAIRRQQNMRIQTLADFKAKVENPQAYGLHIIKDDSEPDGYKIEAPDDGTITTGDYNKQQPEPRSVLEGVKFDDGYYKTVVERAHSYVTKRREQREVIDYITATYPYPQEAAETLEKMEKYVQAVGGFDRLEFMQMYIAFTLDEQYDEQPDVSPGIVWMQLFEAFSDEYGEAIDILKQPADPGNMQQQQQLIFPVSGTGYDPEREEKKTKVWKQWKHFTKEARQLSLIRLRNKIEQLRIIQEGQDLAGIPDVEGFGIESMPVYDSRIFADLSNIPNRVFIDPLSHAIADPSKYKQNKLIPVPIGKGLNIFYSLSEKYTATDGKILGCLTNIALAGKLNTSIKIDDFIRLVSGDPRKKITNKDRIRMGKHLERFNSEPIFLDLDDVIVQDGWQIQALSKKLGGSFADEVEYQRKQLIKQGVEVTDTTEIPVTFKRSAPPASIAIDYAKRSIDGKEVFMPIAFELLAFPLINILGVERQQYIYVPGEIRKPPIRDGGQAENIHDFLSHCIASMCGNYNKGGDYNSILASRCYTSTRDKEPINPQTPKGRVQASRLIAEIWESLEKFKELEQIKDFKLVDAHGKKLYREVVQVKDNDEILRKDQKYKYPVIDDKGDFILKRKYQQKYKDAIIEVVYKDGKKSRERKEKATPSKFYKIVITPMHKKNK